MERFCYHHDDEDGWASAAILKEKYPDIGLQECYNDKEYELVSGYDEVYVVDYSFSQQEFERLEASNGRVIWIDHHKSAIEDVTLDLEGKRDASRAACALTWWYLYPDASLPPVIAHIEDMDLWTFTVEGTESFLAYLKSLLTSGEEVAVISMILREYDKERYQEAYSMGESLNRFEKKIAEKQARTGVRQKLFGYEVVVIFASAGVSLLGNTALELHPDADLAVMIRYVDNGGGRRCFKYSLRSSKEEVDVSSIALQYGGGGHPNAAGFTVDELIL